MPNYKRPGVFVEESLTPLATTFQTPGEATAAFVGANKQGPVVPTLVSSWTQYVGLFGGFGSGGFLLPFAVYQYFNNGGRNAWVVRAAASDAVTATVSLNNRAATPSPLVRFTAKNPGGWANQLTIDVADTGLSTTGRFDIVLRLGGSADVNIVERWLDVSMSPGDSRYAVNLINSPDTGSAYVTLTNLATLPGSPPATPSAPTVTTGGTAGSTSYYYRIVAINSAGSSAASPEGSITTGNATLSSTNFNTVTLPNVAGQTYNVYRSGTTSTELLIASGVGGPSYVDNTPGPGAGTYPTVSALMTYAYAVTDTPAVQVGTPLTSGADGVAVLNLVTATLSLDSIEENLNINLPGVNDTSTINQLITWAETKNNVFFVVDVPQAVPGNSTATTAAAYAALATGGSAFTASSRIAVYSPWTLADDPTSLVPGAQRPLPPGGSVLGRYALTDVTRGVQKPPAGVSARLTGILGLETKFSGSDLDLLNSSGINAIRSIPGAGFCIMGARTLKTGYPDRYVSIRRTLMFLEKALIDGTRFAIFEPNNQTLWDTISSSTSQFLTTQMQSGVLRGNTPNEAFFVVCDATNNTPQRVAQGEVHVQVGVALNSPAEFIIIQLGQFEGSGNATEIPAN